MTNGQFNKAVEQKDPAEVWDGVRPLIDRFVTDFLAHYAWAMEPQRYRASPSNKEVTTGMVRSQIVSRIKEMRDARREFMSACGTCDDGFLSPEEGVLLQSAELLAGKVMGIYRISDEEIEKAELPFTTSTGRKTATPQFPPRFDM